MTSATDLPITHVFRRKDARPIDEAALRGLVASIAELGIIHPLRVRPARRHVAGVLTDAYEVTAGAHRLKAALKIGLETVPCIVVDDDDLRAELVMIDENLMRAELSPAERAKQTARRKALYLELHPETGHGGDRTKQDDNLSSCSFADATADITGRDKRSVQRDAERGEKVAADVLAQVTGTDLDRGNYLDKLKALPVDEQRAKVTRDLDRDEVTRTRAAKVQADVKSRAAAEVASILAEHVPGDWWDGLKANLYAAGAANIANEFTNITGQSIMDRRFA